MLPNLYPLLAAVNYSDDPFAELQETELLEVPPVQRANISTETGAEATISFPDGQVVTVNISGPAFVSIELPVLPKPPVLTVDFSFTRGIFTTVH